MPGQSDAFRAEELYDDVIPCIQELHAAGYRIGVAGNHHKEFIKPLHKMNLSLEFLGSSDEWGVEKPSPRFFVRIAEVSGVAPAEIAYVGDRIDNDILPAKAAGMVGVFLRRGPWSLIQARRPEADQADVRIDSLLELSLALQRR
jgi:HAD superfamily hydrolase (TIGR01549 family)